jgi:hypothetical protein
LASRPITLSTAANGLWAESIKSAGFAEGKIDGRIYEDAHRSTPPELRWFWSVTAIVPAVPNVTNGHAATLDSMKGQHMRVAAMVSAAKPIVRICDLDQDHAEYAEIEFETQANANTAVTQLNEIFRKAVLITFKQP